jgi:hypothetical protein
MATVAEALQEVIGQLDAASQKLGDVCERVQHDVRLYDRLGRTHRRLTETTAGLRKIAGAAGDVETQETRRSAEGCCVSARA